MVCRSVTKRRNTYRCTQFLVNPRFCCSLKSLEIFLGFIILHKTFVYIFIHVRAANIIYRQCFYSVSHKVIPFLVSSNYAQNISNVPCKIYIFVAIEFLKKVTYNVCLTSIVAMMKNCNFMYLYDITLNSDKCFPQH